MIKKFITLLIFLFYLIGLFSTSYAAENYGLTQNLFQDAINKNFKPIDEKVEIFLTNLNSGKNFCFGTDKELNFTECIDKIDYFFDVNSDELVMGEKGYAKACEKALQETINKQSDKTISLKQASIILDKDGNMNSCRELYTFKLSLYKQTAYDILEKNKYQILKDEQKTYTQEMRKRYYSLLDLIRINLGYIERLWKKWPSKTKK